MLKILAIKLRALGDTVIWTGALASLKKHFKNSKITAVAPAQWSPLLVNHPAIDSVLPQDPLQYGVLGGIYQGLKLRSHSWDIILGFHTKPSVDWFSLAAGGTHRANHSHDHRIKNRFCTFNIPGKGKLFNALERDLKVVEGLCQSYGLPYGAQDDIFPKIYLNRDEVNEAEKELILKKYPRPYLALGLGASRETKRWPGENFSKLSEFWKTKTGGSVFAIYQTNDQVDEAQLFLNSPQIIPIKDAPIRRLAAFLSQMQLFLGNDSGPRHLAAAVGTKTVTLFGPEDPYEWHPYLKEKHPYHFIEKLSCRRDALPGMPPWCGLNVCQVEKNRCMKDIGVNEVLETCLKDFLYQR